MEKRQDRRSKMKEGERMDAAKGKNVREDGRSKGREDERSRGEGREETEGMGCSQGKVERVEKRQ